jgi:hypothetical protein
MRTFTKVCAQGDILIEKIGKLPKGVDLVAAERGKVIVAHSETGHNHVMDAGSVTMYRLPDSIMDCFLVVKEATALEHLRPYDTHETIMFEPGVYHVRRQREFVPEGWRRVDD